MFKEVVYPAKKMMPAQEKRLLLALGRCEMIFERALIFWAGVLIDFVKKNAMISKQLVKRPLFTQVPP